MFFYLLLLGIFFFYISKMPQLGLQRGGKDHVSCEVKLFHRFGDLNC